MEPSRRGFAGLRAVLVLSLGQLVSLVGTGMTRFAVSIWIWNNTHSATAVALIWFFMFGPSILVSPLAGTLVDRWSRKRVMMVADLVAGVMSLVLLAVFASGTVKVWMVYLAGAIAAVAESFQSPAQIASVTMMVPQEQHTRANGMINMAQFGGLVLSPVMAGVLIGPIGISGILVVDVATFLFAVGTLLFLLIPQPKAAAGVGAPGSLWQETAAGLKYVLARPPMLHLISIFTGGNLLFGVLGAMFTPMILARTGEDARQLGLLLTINGAGGVVGGLLLSLWRGPKRRIHGVLLGMIGSNLLGTLILGLGQSFRMWAVGAFFATFFFPIMNGCVMAIGQSKVAADLQGRIFGLLRMVAQATFPLALIIAGPLADRFFRPAMQEGGSLVPIFGSIVGVGDGPGMSLLIIASGLLGILVGIAGYLVKTVRDIEVILPDQSPETEEPDGPA